jgi:flagellar hook protein FlgE
VGAKSLTLRNKNAAGNAGVVYGAMGRLDFNGLPTTAATSAMTMAINGTTYTFKTSSGTDGVTAGANTFYSDPTSLSTGTFVGNLASDINKAFNLEYNSLNIDCSAAMTAQTLRLNLNNSASSTPFSVPDTTAVAAAARASTIADSLNSQFSTAGNGLKAVVNGNNVSIYSESAMTFAVDTAGSTGVFNTAANWSDGSGTTSVTSMTTTGLTYCEQLAGTNSLVFRQTDTTDDLTVSGLSSMVLSNGNPATMQAQDLSSPNSFVLAAAPDSTKSAVVFNGDGTPNTINTAFIDVDWANGSTDMSGADSIGWFLGNTGIKDGMTQLNGDYQLNYWTQNGAKFGNFSGVSIGQDGIVTALFDNGVTRPVFQIPIATFTNVNGMESLTGNVFIATDNSGEPTLRSAGSAGAGQVNSASLEASTVDIGTEFTTMIVTQRAYSAASKIITTADQMLDELVQIKR